MGDYLRNDVLGNVLDPLFNRAQQNREVGFMADRMKWIQGNGTF